MSKQKGAAAYPLEIEVLSEWEGNAYGYWSKGHHSAPDFINAAIREWEPKLPIWQAERRAELEARVAQQWWRCVPVSGERCTVYCDAKQGTRGAFPVTVLEDR